MMYDKNKIKELNEFQKKKVKERASIDFYKELNKMTSKKLKFFKVFLNQLEILIKNFDDKGILFFSLTIKLPLSFESEDFWEKVHIEVEEFVNYIGYKVELIEFFYSVIEMEKGSFPFLKAIIGVRSILGGNNKHLILELKELFILSFYDVEVKSLVDYSEIFKYWSVLIQQKNFKFHRFVNYSNFYSSIYGFIADEELKFDDYSAFGQENHFVSSTMNISGIQKKFPKKRELVIYFIKLFMFNKNMKIFNNNIYSRINNSKYSWRVVFSLNDMRKNIIEIFKEIKQLYPQQLFYFDLIDLSLSDLDFVFNKIKKENALLDKVKSFDPIFEFRDGLFFFEEKKFLFFDDIPDLKEFKTIFYTDANFSDFNSAEFWFHFFYENFDIEDLNSIFFNLK